MKKTTLNLNYAMNVVRNFYKSHDRLPSVGELTDLLGYSSRNAAAYVIKRLVKENFVKKDKTGRLMTSTSFRPQIKVLGAVAAGFPTPEEEELRNTLSLDDYLVPHPEATYMLEVKGDSMIGAGIMPHDMVLVEKGRSPHMGDIVVAQVDGEWTMKYYMKENGKVFLRAANPNYPDIIPQEELTLGGIVVSICRKYG